MERFSNVVTFKAKEGEKDGKKTVTMPGIAAPYNTVSKGDYRRVKFLPGSMAMALKKEDLEAFSLFNHDPNWVLGATSNGSLELFEKEDGLHQATHMTRGDNAQIDTMIAHLEANRITRMSFGVEFALDGLKWDIEDGEDVLIVQADGVAIIHDVSPVTYAAFKEARLGQVELHSRELQTTAFKAKYHGPTTKTELDTLKDFVSTFGLTIGKTVENPKQGTTGGITTKDLLALYPHLFQ